ncbi:hypothetical protein DOY81_015234, partial [Sarcophaga bullata]
MSSIGKIGFLGGGKIAQAMAKGLYRPNLGVETITKNDPVIECSNTIFISVKPQTVPQLLDEIKSKSNDKLFISVAMGITLKTLEQNLSPSSRVI